MIVFDQSDTNRGAAKRPERNAILPRYLLMRRVPESRKQHLRRLRRQIKRLHPYPAFSF
jgi:hypothetical protein